MKFKTFTGFGNTIQEQANRSLSESKVEVVSMSQSVSADGSEVLTVLYREPRKMKLMLVQVSNSISLARNFRFYRRFASDRGFGNLDLALAHE